MNNLNLGSVKASWRTGFTLTELLVVIAILVILFALIFQPMMMGLGVLDLSRARSEAQGVARFALEYMARELADAMYVYDIPEPQWTVPDPVSGVPYHSVIKFRLPKRDSNGNISHPLELDDKEIWYCVRLKKPLENYDPVKNPYVLYRRQIDPETSLPITADFALTLKEACTVGEEQGGQFIAFLKFLPSTIRNETLVPNSDHTVYKSQNGLWTASPSPIISVYDSAGTDVTGQRLFKVDYYRGAVNFALLQADSFTGDGTTRSYFCSVMPSGTNPVPNASIIPGTDSVTVGQVPYQRVSWTDIWMGLLNEANQYKINYQTGEVVFALPPPAGANILITYSYRNNSDSDIVKADYTTKCLLTVSLRVSRYSTGAKKGRKLQAVTLTSKIKLRNW